MFSPLRTWTLVAVVIVLLTACNRDRVDSANQPPQSPTTDPATGTAASSSASDTSTTTRPAESVHSDTASTSTNP